MADYEIHDETFEEWAERLFESEYCDECGGDAEHHSAVAFMGNWFARCVWPPDDDGRLHPVIAEYRRKEGTL